MEPAHILIARENMTNTISGKSNRQFALSTMGQDTARYEIFSNARKAPFKGAFLLLWVTSCQLLFRIFSLKPRIWAIPNSSGYYPAIIFLISWHNSSPLVGEDK